MSKLMSLKCLFVCFAFAINVVCVGDSNLQVENDTKQLEKISEQLGMMQHEFRLLTKEVVGLHSRLDKFEKAQISALKNLGATEKDDRQKSVLLDGDGYKTPKLGSKDAKFALVEFSDYECPYCRRYSRNTFPLIKKRYIDTGQLQYVIRDFPLGFHPQAKSAAVAAHCSSEQSKFWEMSEALMNNSNSLSNELYLSLANELGLDGELFKECLKKPEMKSRIEADFVYGQTVGVTGTPRFYIGKKLGNSIVNVVPLSGAQSIEVFDRVIQRVMSEG